MTTEAQEVAGQEAAAAEAAAKAAATAAPAGNPPAGNDPAPEQIEAHDYGVIEDDPGLTMALQFIGKLGVKPDSPELQAALRGDFGFLEAKLASLGAKAQGWEQYLKLGKDSYDKHVKTAAESQAATRQSVEQIAGGAEQWKAVEDWARENADDSEKAELNAAFKAGGFQAKMAASYLCNLHARAGNTVIEPQNAAANVPANGTGFGNSGTPLSPAEFTKAVATLTKTHGAGAINSPEYQALVARRQLFRG